MLYKRTYKVEFCDGPINGAVRYYSTLKTAKTIAKRYVNKYDKDPNYRPYCEIYQIQLEPKFKKELILSIG